MELIGRLQNLLLTPKTEWQAIKREALTIAQLYRKYLFRSPVRLERSFWRKPLAISCGIKKACDSIRFSL